MSSSELLAVSDDSSAKIFDCLQCGTRRLFEAGLSTLYDSASAILAVLWKCTMLDKARQNLVPISLNM